jgi:hypothetical protein
VTIDQSELVRVVHWLQQWPFKSEKYADAIKLNPQDDNSRIVLCRQGASDLSVTCYADEVRDLVQVLREWLTEPDETELEKLQVARSALASRQRLIESDEAKWKELRRDRSPDPDADGGDIDKDGLVADIVEQHRRGYPYRTH